MAHPETPAPGAAAPPDAAPRDPFDPDGGLRTGALAAARFEILTEVACAINSVLDLDQLYWVIYEQCAQVFETDNFWIGRVHDGTSAEAVLWLYQGKQIVPSDQTIPVQPGLNTEVLRTRQTLRVRNYAAATRARGFPLEEGLGPDDNHAWIGVPMLVGDRLIGIIANSRPRPFTADDARLLEAIAALCAVSIENADLVQTVSETAQDLMRRTKELSDLNNVARAVNRSLDLPTVLAQGADMLLRATGWDLATVYLSPPGGAWTAALHRHAGAGDGATPPAWLQAAGGDIVQAHHPLFPFARQVLDGGRPVALDLDTLAPEQAGGLRESLARGLRRLVIFPLGAGPGGPGPEPAVLGLLLLGSRAATAGKVTAEMLRDTTLLAIGEQLAMAVQNARLLDAVQTARSHLEAVLDSTADGVIFYDTNLHIELANRGVHDLYGLPPGALIGKSPEEVADLVGRRLADPDQPATVTRRLREEPPSAVYSAEVLVTRPRRRVFQRSVRPVRDDEGTILGRLVVYHDVTEAKDLERRTRELAGINAVATALNRSLDLNTMLEQAAHAVLDVTGWDTVGIHLWNAATRTWDCALRRQVVPGSRAARALELAPAPGPVHDYSAITPDLLAGRVQTFAVRGQGSGAGGQDIETRLALPIHVRTQTLGMLELGVWRPISRAEVRARGDDATLHGICEQLALAIENSRLYAQARQVAALEERQRLARDLHDSVTQSLFTITLMAEATQAMAARDPTRVGPYLDRVKSTAEMALNEMRALLAQLRPPAIGTSGLGPALRRHAETVGAELGLRIEVDVAPDLGVLPAPVEDALYHITQEALHNVIKHAAAEQAWVRVVRAADRAATLVLTVEDDGQGFDVLAAGGPQAGRRLGLTGMRERAVALGGHLTVESTPGRGSRILVAVPLAASDL